MGSATFIITVIIIISSNGIILLLCCFTQCKICLHLSGGHWYKMSVVSSYTLAIYKPCCFHSSTGKCYTKIYPYFYREILHRILYPFISPLPYMQLCILEKSCIYPACNLFVVICGLLSF